MRLLVWCPLLGFLVSLVRGFRFHTMRYGRNRSNNLSIIDCFVSPRAGAKGTGVDSQRCKCVRDSRGIGASPRVLTMALIDGTDSEMVFAGVKFGSTISSSLQHLGIINPSPIQNEAVLAIFTGLSCIIHAETGSGKTLCYLLPLLKKLLSDGRHVDGVQALIVVPSKELAIQVAADVATLISERRNVNDEIDTSIVHLCIESGRAGLDSIDAPVVIGTPYKLMDAVRSSSKRSLDNLNYLVLDEVDRMLQVSSKYASNEARRKANSIKNPVKDLVADIVRIRGFVPPDKNGLLPPEATSSLQVVAASATIGRPLRRELYHLLLGGGERTSQSAGELPLIRAEAPMSQHVSRGGHGDTKDAAENRDESILDDIIDDDNGMRSDIGTEKRRQSTNSRKIGIPSSIRHVALLLSDQSESLTSKISTVKHMWKTSSMASAKRAMLFVPSSEDVKQVTGMLSFMGLSGDIRDLQGELGIFEPTGGKSKSEKPAKRRPSKTEIADPIQNKRSTKDLVERAAKTKLGAWSVPDIEGRKTADEIDESRKDDLQKDESRELYVIPLSGTRGLHIKNIEYVIITAPPRTMDEYLHIAGRTGRAGNTVPGTVITLASYEELKRLQSWETPLGIAFDVQYE